MLMAPLLFLYLLLLPNVIFLHMWLGPIVQNYCSFCKHNICWPPSNSLKGEKKKKKTSLLIKSNYCLLYNHLNSTMFLLKKNKTMHSGLNSDLWSWFQMVAQYSHNCLCIPNKFTLPFSVMTVSELSCFLKSPILASLFTMNCEISSHFINKKDTIYLQTLSDFQKQLHKTACISTTWPDFFQLHKSPCSSLRPILPLMFSVPMTPIFS